MSGANTTGSREGAASYHIPSALGERVGLGGNELPIPNGMLLGLSSAALSTLVTSGCIERIARTQSCTQDTRRPVSSPIREDTSLGLCLYLSQITVVHLPCMYHKEWPALQQLPFANGCHEPLAVVDFGSPPWQNPADYLFRAQAQGVVIMPSTPGNLTSNLSKHRTSLVHGGPGPSTSASESTSVHASVLHLTHSAHPRLESEHEGKHEGKHEDKHESKHESKQKSKHELKHESKHESNDEGKHEGNHVGKHESSPRPSVQKPPALSQELASLAVLQSSATMHHLSVNVTTILQALKLLDNEITEIKSMTAEVERTTFLAASSGSNTKSSWLTVRNHVPASAGVALLGLMMMCIGMRILCCLARSPNNDDASYKTMDIVEA